MNTQLQHPGAPLLAFTVALSLSFSLTLMPVWLLLPGFTLLLIVGWACVFRKHP